MANKRAKAPAFTSPKGVFKFPKVNAPDTKFKAEGEYGVKLILAASDPAAQGLIAALQPMHDAAVRDADPLFAALPVATRKKLGKVTVNPLYVEVLDEKTEQPTGDLEFVFKMTASGTYKTGPKTGEKWTRKPAVFDARGVKMDKPPQVWGGTVGKVSFEVGLNKNDEPGYFIPGTGAAGLSLRLQAVQIITLVSGGERDAAGYGFGQEDGYSQEPDEGSDEGGRDDVPPAENGGDF